MSYVSGFLAAVPTANKEAYIASARAAWPLFKEYGAIAAYECWGDDVPDGEVTSFPMAVKKKDDETVVFSWIIFRDKAASDACHASYATDERWQALDMPFDGKRMVFGRFEPIFVGD